MAEKKVREIRKFLFVTWLEPLINNFLSLLSVFLQQKSPSGDPSQLDSMLGTLQSDMSKHGISTIPKGDCAACGKSIVGQVSFQFQCILFWNVVHLADGTWYLNFCVFFSSCLNTVKMSHEEVNFCGRWC